MGNGRTTKTQVVEMRSNLRAVTAPEREGAFQRLTAIIGLGALMVRATWALMRWGT